MDAEDNVWLEPEEALTRFKRPDISLLDLEGSADASIEHRYGFKLGNIGFLVPEKTLSEVVRSFQVYPVPNTQLWFQGLTNLRGNLIPVYDLSLMLGMVDQPVAHKNLLVLDKGASSIGMIIDNLPKSYDVSSWHTLMHTPKLPAGLTEFIFEVYSVKDVIWVGFDHKGFFNSIKSKISA